MKRTTITAAAILSLAGAALGITQAAARERDPNRDKIQSARSAAPDAVARDAAVLDWPEAEGQPYWLRPRLRSGPASIVVVRGVWPRRRRQEFPSAPPAFLTPPRLLQPTAIYAVVR